MTSCVGDAGMVANRVEREKKALKEGIDAGMIQLKGMGKRKQRQKERARRLQQGLKEVQLILLAKIWTP